MEKKVCSFWLNCTFLSLLCILITLHFSLIEVDMIKVVTWTENCFIFNCVAALNNNASLVIRNRKENNYGFILYSTGTNVWNRILKWKWMKCETIQSSSMWILLSLTTSRGISHRPDLGRCHTMNIYIIFYFHKTTRTRINHILRGYVIHHIKPIFSLSLFHCCCYCFQCSKCNYSLSVFFFLKTFAFVTTAESVKKINVCDHS